MIIGNDIVDLQNNRPHPRFFERITSEQEKLDHTESLLNCHKLWASKEASYKALKQMFPNLPGVARRFEISKDFQKVTYNQQTLELHLTQTKEYIFAYCSQANEKTHHAVHQLSNLQEYSLAVRELAISKARQYFQDPALDIEVIKKDKDGKIPILKVGTSSYPLSMTHHGRFIAASFLIT